MQKSFFAVPRAFVLLSSAQSNWLISVPLLHSYRFMQVTVTTLVVTALICKNLCSHSVTSSVFTSAVLIGEVLSRRLPGLGEWQF